MNFIKDSIFLKMVLHVPNKQEINMAYKFMLLKINLLVSFIFRWISSEEYMINGKLME